MIREKAPWVDVVMGTHNLDRVLDLLDHAEQWGPITEVVDELQAMPSSLPVKRELSHSAWVTIQVGCNNTCTFCIVPSVRGVEVSRRPGDIVREVERLAATGVVEVLPLMGDGVPFLAEYFVGSARATGSGGFASPAPIPMTSVRMSPWRCRKRRPCASSYIFRSSQAPTGS